MANINFNDIEVVDWDYSHKDDPSSYYIVEAYIGDELATDAQLDEINDDSQLVWELLMKDRF